MRNARLTKALNKLGFTMRSVADKKSFKTVTFYLSKCSESNVAVFY